MQFPNFTVFNLLGTMWFILSIYAIAKILTLDWKLRFEESIYFIITAFTASVVSVVNRDLYGFTLYAVGDLTILFFVFLFFCKIRTYSYKKSAILTFITLYIGITVVYLLILCFHYLILLPGVRLNLDFLPDTSNEVSIFAVQQVLFYFPFFIFPAMLVARLSQKARHIINQSKQLQNILLYVALIQFTLYSILITILRLQGDRPEDWVVSGNAIMFALFGVMFLMSVHFYVRFINTKLERQRKESEHSNLQYYTSQLEQHQIAIQKFKHDYQNILLSMKGYIHDEDWEGLKQYFSSKIEVVSETITNDSFALQNLRKIKIQEVKSLLVAKLMMAQNIAASINVKFEANENIEYIPIDSVALVRMLGIILDNAIEALMELDGGELFVACHKWEAGITFIVQNTCSPDMPPLHELSLPGFSTKGEKRGLGLSNLSEIADSHGNVILETSIKDGAFIQRMLIEYEEEESK